MSTGLFPIRQGKGGPRPGYIPDNRRPFFWSEDQINRLCDYVADGLSIAAAARLLGVSKNAATGQFNRIRASFGWQGE
jgi:hypothetical protein